tara:strand:- start:7 stop:300 length:294 start_codon:yes stop_codon:yes gene_type:complete
MINYTTSITDTEKKCLDFVMTDIQDWQDNAVKNRARIAKKEIIADLVAHCNANGIALAVGEDAQVTQAYDLNVVVTAEQKEIANRKALEARLATPVL